MRSIVIFYSKSGNTLTVANTIKKLLGAHTKEITDFTVHRTILDYLFPNILDSSRIQPRKVDIDYYETIFIGTPVWLGSITPAIKKIIDNMDFKNKNIILFTTTKGIGDEIAMRKLTKLVNKHNGNIIGIFSIISNGGTEKLINCTNMALEDLNLI